MSEKRLLIAKPKHDNSIYLRDMNSPVRTMTSKASMENIQRAQLNPETIKSEIIKNLEKSDIFSKVEGLNLPDFYNRIIATNDSKYLIIPYKYEIIIFDVAKKCVAHTIKTTHVNYILCVVLTKNYTLISCCFNGYVKTWDLQKKKPIESFPQVHNTSITSLCLTADDKYLVCGTKDGFIKVVDLSNGACLRSIKTTHKNEINSVCVTNNSQWIASVAEDCNIRVWSFESLNEVYCFKDAHFQVPTGLKLSHDGKILLSAAEDGSLGLWNIEERKHIYTFVSLRSSIRDFALMHNGRFVLAVGDDNTLCVCDIEARTCLYTFSNITQEVLRCIAITKDDRHAMIIGDNNQIFMMNFESDSAHRIIRDAHSATLCDVREAKYRDGNKYLVSCSDDSMVTIWNSETLEKVHSMEKGEAIEIWKLCISPDGKTAATACANGSVDLWSIEEKSHLFTYPQGFSSGCSHVVHTKDGHKLIATGYNSSIHIYDAQKPTLIRQIENAHPDGVLIAEVTEDNEYVITAGFDKTIAIWKQATFDLFYRINHAHDSSIWCLKVTSDNRFLISSASDRLVKLWDLTTRKAIQTFKTTHSEEIRGLVLSTDESFVLSLDFTSNINIHTFKNKEPTWTYTGLGNMMMSYASITSDNKHFLIPSGNDIHIIENSFQTLTVQFAKDCLPWSFHRFMPLAAYLLNEDISGRQQFIKAYPDLRVFPYDWNWFHIVAIYSPHQDLILSCLKNKVPFTTDSTGRTPLHYMFTNEQADRNGINIILSSFPTILETADKPSELLSVLSDIFIQLLELDNAPVIKLLKVCLRDPEPAFGHTIDSYGQPKGSARLAFSSSKYILYSKEIKQNLVSENLKQQKISIKVLPFYWDYSIESSITRNLVTTLLNSNNQEIFQTKVISLLIEYLWRHSKRLHYFMATIFSVQALLISIYTAQNGRNLGFEISIFLFSLFFMVFEVLEGISEGIIEYLSSIWNYVDISCHLLTASTIIVIWTGVDDTHKQWLFSFILAFTYTRWISYFRVFNQTRRLIRMIVQILKDTRGFASLLFFILVGLSLIFLQFDRNTAYGNHLLNSYLLLFSQFDVTSMNTGMLFFSLIVVALICIVLLNMLITIMGDTFAQMQERVLLVDTKEKLELISETMKMLRVFRRMRLRSKIMHEENASKYMFCAEPKVEEEEELDEQEKGVDKEELQNQLEAFKKEFKRELQEQQKGLAEQQRLIQKDLKEQKKMIEEIFMMLKANNDSKSKTE